MARIYTNEATNHYLDGDAVVEGGDVDSGGILRAVMSLETIVCCLTKTLSGMTSSDSERGAVR